MTKDIHMLVSMINMKLRDDDMKLVHVLSIYDLKEDESIFDKITFYYDNSKESKLYLVNENNNYMIIDYKNNSYKSYDKNNLSNELEKIFDSTKMIKLQKINYETLGSDEPALIIDN